MRENDPLIEWNILRAFIVYHLQDIGDFFYIILRNVSTNEEIRIQFEVLRVIQISWYINKGEAYNNVICATEGVTIKPVKM